MPRILFHGASVSLAVILVATIFDVDRWFVCLHLGLLLLSVAIYGLHARWQPLLARWLQVPLLLILVPLMVFHADNYQSYGPILRETIDAMFQSSNSEAVSYVQAFASPMFMPMALVCLTLTLLGLFLSAATSPGAIAGLAGAGLLLLFMGRELPVLLYQTAVDYADTLDNFAQSRTIALEPFAQVQTDFKGNVVVLMGESLGRAHMGIYGYPRQTTPSLNRFRPELSVYPDVISTHSHTTESLSRALTLNDGEVSNRFEQSADILGLAKLAGLKTYWLSNQNAIGYWDNAVAAIASQADVVRYHDPGAGFMLQRRVFDDVLVDSLASVLAEPAGKGKLIFLHMMAPHFPYCGNVPENFEIRGFSYDNPTMDRRFLGHWIDTMNEQMAPDKFVSYFADLNCYDRGVNYVDRLAGQVLAMLQNEAQPTVMLFTADHGEAPILATGHESRVHSHFHVEVPFIVWMNQQYRALAGEAVVLDPGRPGTLADLSYAIADLGRLQGIANLGSRSLFSSTYDMPARYTMDGKVGYDVFDPNADHMERTRANLLALTPQDRKRIWVHRTNSGAAMLETASVFAGVEMDLVFEPFEEAGRFAVYHPPAPDTGLDLELQLKQDQPGLGYWLDWKNTSDQNIEQAIKRLADLDRTYQFKSRAIVESSSLGVSARALAEAGFHSSYYLPTEEIASCMASCDDEQQRLLGKRLLEAFRSAGFQAVSFDVRLLPFVKRHMLASLRAANVPAYTWATMVDISSPTATEQLTPILAEDWISVVLVTQPSFFWQ